MSNDYAKYSAITTPMALSLELKLGKYAPNDFGRRRALYEALDKAYRLGRHHAAREIASSAAETADVAGRELR